MEGVVVEMAVSQGRLLHMVEMAVYGGYGCVWWIWLCLAGDGCVREEMAVIVEVVFILSSPS